MNAVSSIRSEANGPPIASSLPKANNTTLLTNDISIDFFSSLDSKPAGGKPISNASIIPTKPPTPEESKLNGSEKGNLTPLSLASNAVKSSEIQFAKTTKNTTAEKIERSKAEMDVAKTESIIKKISYTYEVVGNRVIMTERHNASQDEVDNSAKDQNLIWRTPDGKLVVPKEAGLDMGNFTFELNGKKVDVSIATKEDEAYIKNLLTQHLKNREIHRNELLMEHHIEDHKTEKKEKKEEKSDFALIQAGRSSVYAGSPTVAKEKNDNADSKYNANLNMLLAPAHFSQEQKKEAIEKKREMEIQHAKKIHDDLIRKDILARHGASPTYHAIENSHSVQQVHVG